MANTLGAKAAVSQRLGREGHLSAGCLSACKGALKKPIRWPPFQAQGREADLGRLSTALQLVLQYFEVHQHTGKRPCLVLSTPLRSPWLGLPHRDVRRLGVKGPHWGSPRHPRVAPGGVPPMAGCLPATDVLQLPSLVLKLCHNDSSNMWIAGRPSLGPRSAHWAVPVSAPLNPPPAPSIAAIHRRSAMHPAASEVRSPSFGLTTASDLQPVLYRFQRMSGHCAECSKSYVSVSRTVCASVCLCSLPCSDLSDNYLEGAPTGVFPAFAKLESL